MLIRRITELGITHPRLLSVVAVSAYSKLCPSVKSKACTGRGKANSSRRRGSPSGGSMTVPVRAQYSGPCRLGFIPEEWFLFLHSKTGVSGPYFLMIGLINYVASKEIYVMEHEYYSGLSIVLVLYLLSTRLGPEIGAYLDKEVNAVHESFQKGRDADIAFYENVIQESQTAQIRALAQKELMTAKKENIAFQLEAIYRERFMMVYTAVRNRMDYHVKVSRTKERIHHKWMYYWIMKNVYKAITPEFKKEAMKSALKQLAAQAPGAKK